MREPYPKIKIEWLSFFGKLDDNIKQLAEDLKAINLHSVYLSHHAHDEMRARIFAEKLSRQGIEVIVAADVRPKVHWVLATEEDKAKVSRMIATTDMTIVLEA